MARFHTTVTERGSFRSCRRQWYLEVQERLAHKDRVGWNLIFGDCIHKALEVYYTKNERSITKAKNVFKRAWAKEDKRLEELYGGLYKQGIEEEWYAWREKGLLMLDYYKIYDAQGEFDFDKVLAVNIEQRAFVEILEPTDSAEILGHPLLSGKIDLVVERHDGVWIWDHKTTATAYDARALDIDDQGTGYAYIYWRLTGTVPRGFIHNGLIKDPPSPPRVLQNGSLSKDKAQRTTFDLYVKAIEENELDPSDYEDILEYLQRKGWSQFFVRDAVVFNEEQLYSFEERLYYEYLDMKRTIEDPNFAYPNPSQRMCPGCAVLPICQTMEEGDDPQYLKENMYVVQPVRAKIPKEV